MPPILNVTWRAGERKKGQEACEMVAREVNEELARKKGGCDVVVTQKDMRAATRTQQAAMMCALLEAGEAMHVMKFNEARLAQRECVYWAGQVIVPLTKGVKSPDAV